MLIIFVVLRRHEELVDRLGTKSRAVDYMLRTLLNRSYIERTSYGAFRKMGTKRRSAP